MSATPIPLPTALNPDDELAELDLADIGWRIRALRKSRGWTQDDLGDAVGGTRATVSWWECGKRPPSLTHFLRLADALDVKLDYLMRGRS